MDNNTHRRGVREHVYQPNMIWPWVFRQAEVWVDPHGSEHEIASMPLDELECALRFCLFEAERIRNLCYVEWVGRGFEFKLNGVPLDLALALAGPKPDTAGDPREWMQATPLLRALRARHDELSRERWPCRDDGGGRTWNAGRPIFEQQRDERAR